MSIEMEPSVYFWLYLFAITFYSFVYNITLLSLCVIYLVILLSDDKSVDEETTDTLPMYCF